MIPIDPALLPDFRYQPSGFLEKIFPPLQRRSRERWDQYTATIIKKYKQFREPYFVNFLLLRRNRPGELSSGGTHSNLELLEALLKELGFAALKDFNDLTSKLVNCTALQEEYTHFRQTSEHFLKSDLTSTLQTWIDERGTAFRSQLPLMLYFCWDRGHHTDEIQFLPDDPPLVREKEMRRLYGLCNDLRLQILVDRLQTTLERFDPSEYVTIYDADAMSGAEFEDFLEEVFRARGYETESTPRSGDQGADLLAERFGQTVAVQAKNYQGTVGNAAVQQAISAREFYSASKAMVVTTSRFSSSAEQLAESSEVKLVDRDGLQAYIDDYNQYLLESGKAT